MPYKQRRKPRRQRAPQGGKGSYLDTASRALAVAYAVKKLINVEYFQLQTTIQADPNTSGNTQNLTAIAQGDIFNDRQGNKIRLKYLRLSGIVTLNASASDTQVRMVIVRDNNGSTTNPTISSLYTSLTVFHQNQPKLGDPQTNSRFSILWDKMVIVNTDTPTKQFSYSMVLDHHVYFTGAATTDEGKGHLYLMIASSEVTNDPVVKGAVQVKWLDN